jgi:hypothetical protein
MAHHCVQPWQVLATHSPFAGPAAFALRTAMALVCGCVAQPAASIVAVAADALMNSRLVSLMSTHPFARRRPCQH